MRLLSRLHRWSARVRVLLTVVLLAMVYVLFLGPFAAGRKLFGNRRRRGWASRGDDGVGTLSRLEKPF